jgi:hypothetical protein
MNISRKNGEEEISFQAAGMKHCCVDLSDQANLYCSPQSQNQLTESEMLALAAEMDGTLEGDIKSEEKRKKDEDWAAYTDAHRKGEGNTTNRG